MSVTLDLLPPGPPVAVFDVGGTDVKSGLVLSDGRLERITHRPTPGIGGDVASAVIELITAQTAEWQRELRSPADASAPTELAGVGLIVPGYVDDERGIGVFSENLRWQNAAFRERLTAATGLPVGFGHDVSTAGLAEFQLGAAAGVDRAAVLVIGTGIACALLLHGELFRGGGHAGEIGHTIVVPDGEPCVCGGRGCFEATASAASIARRYRAATGSDVPGAREVLELVDAGDPVAVAIWDSAIDAIVAALMQLAQIISPERVVIGGGLAGAGERLLAPIRERLQANIRLQPMPEIVRAKIGPHAGLVGAALLARERA